MNSAQRVVFFIIGSDWIFKKKSGSRSGSGSVEMCDQVFSGTLSNLGYLQAYQACEMKDFALFLL